MTIQASNKGHLLINAPELKLLSHIPEVNVPTFKYKSDFLPDFYREIP
jgi:hypothetical protein